MSFVNLFGIERSSEINNAFEDIVKTWNVIAPPKTIEINKRKFTIHFYSIPYSNEKNKEISWNWVYIEFGVQAPEVTNNPRAVLIIETDNEKKYCVSFGNAFFLVDKFCNREFGFDFAKKMRIKKINTSTKFSPGHRRNKTMNTYKDQMDLDHDSSEAYAKLKITEDLEPGFDLYKPVLSIGQSIRFDIGNENNSLERVVQLVLHVENVIKNKPDINEIPRYRAIKDLRRIERLENILVNEIKSENVAIYTSDLDIYGATEIINNADLKFRIQYNNCQLDVTEMDWSNLRIFCEKFSIDRDQQVLNFKVACYKNDKRIFTCNVRDLIEFTCDSEWAILSRGKWYEFNQNFIKLLHDSLRHIPTEYCGFADIDVNEYKKIKSSISKESEATANKPSYTERIFNILRQNEGYQLLDRELKILDGHSIEIADLYKQNELIAVKIGGSSEKLGYAIDQSLTGMMYYKLGTDKALLQVNTIAIWLVLRRSSIEDHTKKPDLTKLRMLTLKMKLDHWAREVRNNFITPKVYVSYIK